MKHNTFFNLSYFDENDNLVIENFHLMRRKEAIRRYLHIVSKTNCHSVRFTQQKVYRDYIETIILDNGKPF